MTKSVKLFILAFFSIVASASAAPVDMAAGFEVPAVIENGDTIPEYTLSVIIVFPPTLEPTDARKRRIFWRIVRDVKKTYPYARMIAAEVNKVDASTRGLYASRAVVGGISNTLAPLPARVMAQPRYRAKAEWASCEYLEEGKVRLGFDTPLRALAVGQVCAFYDGGKLLGGGFFESIEP